ncbi:hypothetical protein [Qipengyuania qiaonensis]|uniref:Uncharacterized protein n=1 Tax=Qipengyuania qiaonensis TaxID=2867240 RepID=A0ABS7J0Y2_9SPHN|nr:hypothetical protein [Qipengyuania qiaonensis]MBX7481000.1 hypothetical protein [Qipengyuania qiaonensis]
MNEGEREYLQDHIVGWRRMDAWEASQRSFMIFGIAMTGSVAMDWLLRSEIRYERAFWFSLMFSIAFGICSMIFKIRPVFRK